MNALDPEDAKVPGQKLYEQFVRDEYAKPERLCWNRWETLTPELKAGWVQAEIFGTGRPEEMMRNA